MTSRSTIKQSTASFQRAQISCKPFCIPVLAIVLLITMVVCLGVGAVPIQPYDILSIFFHRLGWAASVDIPTYHESVLFNIRMPRLLLGVLVGACLAVCGAVLQGLFRNPLAEPALVGVSSGGSLAAVATIFFSGFIAAWVGEGAMVFVTPFSAFLGGIVITVFVYLLATKESRTDMSMMLLAGIAVNALAAAGIGLFIFAGDDQQVRAILFWMFGSLGGAMWNTLLPTIPFILAAIFAILWYGHALNLYLLGEHEARHLGVHVQKMKWLLIALVALGVGATVSLCGIIGFVGLVVPHLLRLSFGPDNRLLLPASALLGGILLLLADVIARTIVAPTELPIGLVTSLLGSPFFLYLLVKQKRNVRL